MRVHAVLLCAALGLGACFQPALDQPDADADTSIPLNACGGTGALSPGLPGASCGPCLDGEWACDPADPQLNTTVCVGASVRNACQGCDPLVPPLESPCGECGITACGPDGQTRCAEPAEGCHTWLTCEDVDCGQQRRTCIEPEDGDAYCGECIETYIESGGQCVGQALAPATITATTTLDDRVEIRWDASTHATGYRLYRCLGTCNANSTWTELIPVQIAGTSYPDATVAAPAAPAAPDVSATTDVVGHVRVSWGAVTAPAAPRASYRVVAVGPSGESAPSAIAVGHLAERPTTGYEVSIAGGDWSPVEGTAFNDTAAAPATLVAGLVTATQGTHAQKVSVELTSWNSNPGANRQYRVRALTRSTVGAEGTATGRRVAGPIQLTWERSAGPSPTDFAAIPNASGTPQTLRHYDDTDNAGIPPGGVVRYYRARLTAEGTTPITSEPAAGWRQPAPGVPQIQSVSTELNDRIEIQWTPVDDAIAYHIYRDGVRLTQSQGVNCSSSPCLYGDLGAPAPGAWPAPSQVTATTNDTTGVTVSWTLPQRPRGANRAYEVSAINATGESERSPAFGGWRSAPPLTGVEVKSTVGGSDTAHFLDATATSLSHAAAPHATFAPATLTATGGDHRNHVRLTLTGGTLGQAPTVSYQVRGQLAGSNTAWSTATTGRRGTGAVARAWQYASPSDPDTWANLPTEVCAPTSTTCDDTTAEGVGTKRRYRLTLSAPGATSSTTPTVEGWRLAFTHVDGSFYTMCAVDTTGRLWVWGQSTSGEGSLAPRLRSQGPFVTCTSGGSPLTFDGAGYGCGINAEGTASCGNFFQDTPIFPRTDLGTIRSLSIGGLHSCAVKTNGQAVCWGWNNVGQLGSNSDTTPNPVTVVRQGGTTLTGLAQVSVGAGHTCALSASGSVWCWGDNNEGQLGLGDYVSRSFAVQATSLSGASIVAAGLSHTCVRLSNREVVCMGSNSEGQLGNWSDDSLSNVPVGVLTRRSPTRPQLSADLLTGLENGACSLRTNQLWCWGQDVYGTLGDGLPLATSDIAIRTTLAGAASTIGGRTRTACVVIDGGLWCWGVGVGDGTREIRASPTLPLLP